MRAPDIAVALGGAHRSGAWWRCRCPVHHSRGATLALRDGDRGLIAVCHAGCSRADVISELRRCGLIIADRSGDLLSADHRARDRHECERPIEIARRIWNSARDARESPVARYLAGRGIAIPVPSALRYASSLRRPDGTHAPAMVARIDNLDGQLIGVSRTWLARDRAGIWRRRDRAMLGRAAGGNVRLAPAAETLMVAEGIETAMAAMQAAAQPAWAALSTSGMVALILPPIVRTVIILADHDRSSAGERAARTAAVRWIAEGRRARIAMPPEPDTDFNDVLLGRAYARIEGGLDVAA
jgi:putative DNA primase/helicase